MKFYYLTIGLVMALSLLTSCATDGFTSDVEQSPAVISLSLSTGTVTRTQQTLPAASGNTIGNNEAALHQICVAIFDSSDKLITLHEYTYSGAKENIITTTAASEMLVFANVPASTFVGKTTLTEIETTQQDLGYTTSDDGLSNTAVTTSNSQKITSLPMASSLLTVTFTDKSFSPTVELVRKVARVALTGITSNFSGVYSGSTFTPTDIFVYRASNMLTHWVQNTVSGDVSGENISTNANTKYLGSGTLPTTITYPYFFYVFPHSSTSPTKLVVKGTFKTATDIKNSAAGVTKYYPIVINKAQDGVTFEGTQGTDSQIDANKIYNLSLTLQGVGVDSPADDIVPTSVTVNTSVSTATSAIVPEIFPIPNVGDIYFSDGTYSSTLVTGKTPIGIVVSTNADYCEAAYGYGHGLVMALKDAASSVAWSTVTTDLSANLPFVTTVGDWKSQKSGLIYTNYIKNNISDYATTYPAFNSALTYSATIPSSGTSGWFLPSSGQWYEAMVNAQTYYNANSGSTLSIPYSSITDATIIGYTIGSYAENCATEMNYMFSSKGLTSYTSIHNPTGSFHYYWTSSEYNAYSACFVGFDSNDDLNLDGGGKANTIGKYVRLFLAF